MCGRRARRGHGTDSWASVSPRGQILAALAVLVPVALSGLALVALAPGLWWAFMTYFWISFPALRLLTRGLTGLSGRGILPASNDGGERGILEALREHGELTPARAAMETSLTVAEADEMLKGLAGGGHLEVRVRGGALSYALWETPERNRPRVAVDERGLKNLEPYDDRERRGLERSGT